MPLSSASSSFVTVLREACRWIGYALKGAMIVLGIALAVQLVSGAGGSFLEGLGVNQARGLIISMLAWFLAVGLAAVLLRLIRTGQGSGEEFFRPFQAFWTILGTFFIEVMIGVLVWLVLSPFQTGTYHSAFLMLLVEGLVTLIGLIALAFFFPVPYVIVDEGLDGLGPVAVFRRALELTKPHWRLVVAFAVMEYVFLSFPAWVALPIRTDDLTWTESSNWIWIVRIFHWATGIFTAFVAALLYEGLRRSGPPAAPVRTDS